MYVSIYTRDEKHLSCSTEVYRGMENILLLIYVLHRISRYFRANMRRMIFIYNGGQIYLCVSKRNIPNVRIENLFHDKCIFIDNIDDRTYRQE